MVNQIHFISHLEPDNIFPVSVQTVHFQSMRGSQLEKNEKLEVIT